MGVTKTKVYSNGETGTFDDGMQDVAGGQLLRRVAVVPPYRMAYIENNERDIDGDSPMNGARKTHATWVSPAEIERCKRNRDFIRCGKSGHLIKKCPHLFAECPEVKLQAIEVDDLTPKFYAEIRLNKELKD